MRINSIQTYSQNRSIKAVHKKQNNSLSTAKPVNFQGGKEAAFGALLGGIAGVAVTVLTAGAAAPLIPEMVLVCGAVGMAEDSDDKNNNNKK